MTAEETAADGTVTDGTATEGSGAEEAFEEVRVGLARLLADLPRLPSALRVQARDVAIEVTWDAPGVPEAAAGAPAVAPAALPAAPQESDAGLLHVVAPTVGVFYRAPEPGAAPFVDVGTVVESGEQVAIVEAMKLFLPVEAERRGRVAAVLVQDGASVEYGEPLLALEPIEA
ncbi:MAG TPA: biotin/lipoyl-containing protein [Spirillospora sp.]|nr:biotin/lipoyl-containing protein [Spirillospora sp.]